VPVSDKLYWFATGARAQGGRVVTVEAKPENAAVARAVVKYAKQDRVEVFGGKLAEDALPDVYAALGRPADLVFALQCIVIPTPYKTQWYYTDSGFEFNT
jgi:hypothetical protein